MTGFPQPGGCLCGDVRFALDVDPLCVYACHCTDCQIWTGAAFTLSMVVRREALRLERGLPEADLRFEGAAGEDAHGAMVRLWKARRAGR